MSLILPSRRGFIVGAAATLFAAPAIVRAASLMPIRPLPIAPEFIFCDPVASYLVEYDAFAVYQLTKDRSKYRAAQFTVSNLLEKYGTQDAPTAIKAFLAHAQNI